MDIAGHRIRSTLTLVGFAVALLGCTSGSEAVPVPGADDVVTAPVATVELPPTTQAGVVDSPPRESVTSTIVRVEEQPVETEPEPVVTEAAPPPETNAAPPATEAPSDDGFFRLGDEGPEVGLMQFKLSVLDYLPVGSDTGVFDQATENGLRRFQADYGLGVDGVFGPLTNRSLNAAVQSVNVEG